MFFSFMKITCEFDGQVLLLLAKNGKQVSKDQLIASVRLDDGIIKEIRSPVAGTLSEWKIEKGNFIKSG